MVVSDRKLVKALVYGKNLTCKDAPMLACTSYQYLFYLLFAYYYEITRSLTLYGHLRLGTIRKLILPS